MRPKCVTELISDVSRESYIFLLFFSTRLSRYEACYIIARRRRGQIIPLGVVQRYRHQRISPAIPEEILANSSPD